MILNNGIVERRVLKDGNQFGLNAALFIINAEKKRHKDCIFFRQEGRQLIRITAFERGGKSVIFVLMFVFAQKFGSRFASFPVCPGAQTQTIKGLRSYF